MLDGGHGFEMDIDAVTQNVDEAEIVSLYFPLLRKTLLIDTRTDAAVGPFVSLVEMVDNASQRFRSMRRLRPQFDRPGSITLIPWVLSVGSLRGTGVWEHLLGRLDDCGGQSCIEAATQCLEELLVLERRELLSALTGEHYRTLWGREGIGDLRADGDD